MRAVSCAANAGYLPGEIDMKETSARRARGLAMYEKLGWGTNEGLRSVDEEVWGLTTDFILGDVWSRPGLSLREKQLVTLAALISISSEGMAHLMRHAHEIGVTDDDMKGVIIQTMYYVGQPRGFFALRRLNEVIAAREAEHAGADAGARNRKRAHSGKKTIIAKKEGNSKPGLVEKPARVKKSATKGKSSKK